MMKPCACESGDIENDYSVRATDGGLILFSGYITRKSVDEFIASLLYFDQKETDIPIQVVFSTAGGSVYDALRLIDAMRYMVSRPVAFYASGYVQSAGILVLSAAEERYSFPNSVFLFHPISITTENLTPARIHDFSQAFSIFISKMKKFLVDELEAFTEEEVKDINREHYFDEKEALKRGLITQVVEELLYPLEEIEDVNEEGLTPELA